MNADARVVVAFLVAPVTVPLIFAILSWTVIPLMLVTLSYPIALLAGIPAYLFLKRIGHLEFWTVVLLSGFLAGLAGLIVNIFIASTNTGTAGVLWSGAFGSITGLEFWLIAFAGLRSNNRWRGP